MLLLRSFLHGFFTNSLYLHIDNSEKINLYFNNKLSNLKKTQILWKQIHKQ
jgi:hypothetical protein